MRKSPVGRLLLLLIGGFAAQAGAATPGFVEDFTAGTGGFTPGSAVTQVTSGGVGGASDPYLSIANSLVGFLGSASTAVPLTGNLTADGVTGYSFWLRDTGANDSLQIHVGVGTTLVNFWLSVPGFTPPDGSWQMFTVDVTNASQWVQIIGTGTFQDALASSDRLLFRHDVPPLGQFPDAVAADFGLDRISVLPTPAGVPSLRATGGGALAALLLGVGVFGLARRQLATRGRSRPTGV